MYNVSAKYASLSIHFLIEMSYWILLMTAVLKSPWIFCVKETKISFLQYIATCITMM